MLQTVGGLKLDDSTTLNWFNHQEEEEEYDFKNSNKRKFIFA